MGRQTRLRQQKKATSIRVDLGCGPHPKDGFLGVDLMDFGGKVDLIHDLRQPWPWADGQVEEAHCSHFLHKQMGMSDQIIVH